MMLDFTSALYLGLHHSSRSLGHWNALTLGQPSALQAPPGSDVLAQDLAQLQGCEAGLLCPSTLHLFWDLFQILGQKSPGQAPVAILVDAASYPIARWGVERVAARGVFTTLFPQHSVPQVARLARRAQAKGLRPVIVTDGYSPALGAAAPLAEYAEIARCGGGYLVLDDTQALGLFGVGGNAGGRGRVSWGRGGGGTLQMTQVFGPHVVVGASLAKAFGAPLAVLAGSRELIRRFQAGSQAATHCSPPSVPVILAAQRALRMNRQYGERLRGHLMQLVCQLRSGLRQLGLETSGGDFPVQTIASTATCDCLCLHEYLLRHGVNTVLQPAAGGGGDGGGAWLSFVLTANHTVQQVAWVTGLLMKFLRRHYDINIPI